MGVTAGRRGPGGYNNKGAAAMPRKDPVGSPLAPLVPILQAVAGMGVSAYAWAVFDPTGFSAAMTAAVPICRMLGAGCITGGIGYAWWRSRQHPITPTHEDWACGTYITGKPGSGKTAWAYHLVREFCDRGWGWIWLSIKPSIRRDPAEPARILEFLPDVARERCLLFAPYSDSPRGINFLRCYTSTSQERELLADQTAELFERLHGAMSGNMRELIRMGTLGLLGWADREVVTVTLWELYRLFQESTFRDRVMARANKPIRDAFAEAEPEGRNGQRRPNETLLAVRRQLRRAVSSDSLLAALAQTDGIDLWQVMESGSWLVCDTPQSVLGPAVASFLCQVISSRVQLLTDRRPAGSRPFGMFCDEFQRYANPSFALAIETAREFGVAWHLIHQSENGQDLGRAVQGAVDMCGSRYYFTQTFKDAKGAAAALGDRWTAEAFAFLPKRHYKGYRRLHGRPVIVEGVTPDLPSPNNEVAAEIIRRASAGPGRAAILAEIQRRKVGGRHDERAEGTPAAAGAV